MTIATEAKERSAQQAELEPATTRKGEKKDYWSNCGQVFFTGGKGYGLTPSLETICLGEQQDIEAYLAGGTMQDNLTPVQRQTLVEIGELTKEKDNHARTTEVRRPSAVRSRPAGAVKRRAAKPRRPAKRKRLPVH